MQSQTISSYLEIAYRTKVKGLILKTLHTDNRLLNFAYFMHESIIESFYVNLGSLFDRRGDTIGLNFTSQHSMQEVQFFTDEWGQTIQKVINKRNNLIAHRNKGIYENPSENEPEYIKDNRTTTNELLEMIDDLIVVCEGIMPELHQNKDQYEQLWGYLESPFLVKLLDNIKHSEIDLIESYFKSIG